MFGEIIFRILSDPWAILLVVLFFSASIFVHELGHYLAARARGLVIDRFSIGFGPKLFAWKDKHDVEWRISLFPLGGYVALPQLADMSGVEGESRYHPDALKPITYSDKMIVSAAGAAFNILFALALGTILWISGIDMPEERNSVTVGYVVEQMSDETGQPSAGPAHAAGIQPGDRILTIDGNPVENWEDVTYAIATGVGRDDRGQPRTEIEVQREGRILSFAVTPLLDPEEGMRRIGVAPANTLKVGDTMENSPARVAGLEPGDVILAVDGNELYRTESLSRYILDRGAVPMELVYERGGERFTTSITPEEVVVNTDGDKVPMIGVRWEPVTILEHIDPFHQITNAVHVTLRVLGALLHPQSDVGLNNLSGPVGITYTLYVISQIGILDLIGIVVLINVNLAILNLLPIPVLDGGHMMFATIARLRRKPLPVNMVASLQGMFMLLFLAMFFYVTFFDVGRVSRNERATIEAERSAAQRVEIRFEPKE